MKNLIKFFGIMVFATIVGFTISACKNDKDGSIPVKVRAFNNNGVQPAQAMAIRTLQAIEIMPLSSSSFDVLNGYYTNLGTSTGQYTPSKFALYFILTAFLSNGDHHTLGYGTFDFTKGLTVDVGDIVDTGITVSAFHLAFGGSQLDKTIEFDNGKTISTLEIFSLGSDNFSSIIFYGSELKLHPGTLTGPGGSTIPNPPYPTGGPTTFYNVVVPFSSISIPDSASSATLNISMDLTDIIEKYGTDLYILKKGWWDNVHLTATVQ